MNKSDLFIQTDDSSPRAGCRAARTRPFLNQKGEKQSGREEKIEIGKPKHSLSLSSTHNAVRVYFCSVWLEKSRHRIWHPSCCHTGDTPSRISYLPTADGVIFMMLYIVARGAAAVFTPSFSILITTWSEKAHAVPNAAIFAAALALLLSLSARRRLLSLIEPQSARS